MCVTAAGTWRQAARVSCVLLCAATTDDGDAAAAVVVVCVSHLLRSVLQKSLAGSLISLHMLPLKDGDSDRMLRHT